MAILLSHFAHAGAALLEALAAGAQTGLFVLEVAGAQQHPQGLHLDRHVRAAEGQLNLQQVGRGGQSFQVSLQHGIEQVQWQQAAGESQLDQIQIDGVGEVAQTPLQRLVQRLPPLQQLHRLLGHQALIPIGFIRPLRQWSC